MKRLLMILLLMSPLGAEALTLGEAQTEAHQWVVPRQTAILDRVETCVTEGNERLCHTAWAASVTPNTAPADAQLATVTLDDPGRQASTVCGTCFTGQGTFAAAAIAIPATAPINARLSILKGVGGRGVELTIEIQYDGTKYRRTYARGIGTARPWAEVVVIP